MAGRKTKLTPAVQEGIVKALAVGATHEQAYGYMGITHETFYKWLRLGETGRAPYAEFLDAVKKTEQQAAVGWLAFIESAARAGNWQAAAWKLERRYPKVWGRQLVEHTVQQSGPVEFVLKVVYANERPDTAPGRGADSPQIPAPPATPFLIQPGEA